MQEMRPGALALVGCRLPTPLLEMARGRLAAFKDGLYHHKDLGERTALGQA